MEWLTNTFNPNLDYLKDKIIADPEPGHYSVEELKAMNMVGVYK